MNLRLSNISHGGTGSLGNYRGLVIHVANPFCGLRRTSAPRAGERRGGSGPVQTQPTGAVPSGGDGYPSHGDFPTSSDAIACDRLTTTPICAAISRRSRRHEPLRVLRLRRGGPLRQCETGRALPELALHLRVLRS